MNDTDRLHCTVVGKNCVQVNRKKRRRTKWRVRNNPKDVPDKLVQQTQER